MSLDLEMCGYTMVKHITIGHGAFYAFRQWLLDYMPLDVQLRVRAVWGLGIEPDKEWFKDVNSLKRSAYQFFLTSDLSGRWDEQPHQIGVFLGVLRNRIPPRYSEFSHSHPNSIWTRDWMYSALDEMIAMFIMSEMVEYQW